MLRDHENENNKKEQMKEENTDPKPGSDNGTNETEPAGVSGQETAGDAALLKEQLSKKEAESKEQLDRMQRLAAEFDNFRKRTQKEKDRLYADAVVDVVARFLPIVDGLERALKAAGEEEQQGLKEGICLVYKQLSDILTKLDVKPIEAVGKAFNPELHNAVMHVEDETMERNLVVEEFQKGFVYKDETVIRHSMVKVAN